MKKASLFIALALSISALTCTNSPSNIDDSSGSLLPGYFSGTAGAEQSSQHYEEFNGSARYSISDEDTTFSIVLTSTISPGDTTQILLQTKSVELPDEASFTLRNIDSYDQIYFGDFSLFYHSALTNKNEVYFSESGTLNVLEITTIGIKGTLEGTVFQKAYTGKNEYVRIYSSLNLDFYAISGD